jgi:hypothetical protein
MIWFLSGLLSASVMLYVAPRFALAVGGIFGGLCFGLWAVVYGISVLVQ